MARWSSKLFAMASYCSPRATAPVMARSRTSVRYPAAMATNDPELIIGLVAPLGTSTTDLTKEIQGSLSRFGYKAVPIKLSELLPTAAPPPTGEAEDMRIRRLIEAGNEFCKVNEDAAAVARLAVNAIRARRIELVRADDDHRPIVEIADRPRTAYVVQSLKRREEVQLLREVYGSQFILIGSQGSVAERTESLLQLNLSSADDAEKRDIVKKLIDIDADEREQLGQNVNRTYPQADFFVRRNERADIDRVLDLLFQKPEPPTIGEYAMYVALASSARSLAASRKVGAAIVVDDAVVATGYNDVPYGQIPDVLEGEDTSETFKRENLRDTLRRLKEAGLLADKLDADDEGVARAAAALDKGELLSVIEYQRAVHAEARAIDDATVRGVSPAGGTLFVTTYPCHLCYKHSLSVRLDRIEYIEPYPKSRAVAMFSRGAEDRLVPFAGVAPRRYMPIFCDRPAFVADASGKFPSYVRKAAQPLVGQVREDEDRADRERRAINALKKEFRI
jgi:deoxycytidylate deaminase